MTNLKLITTETFGDLPCNFYHNMNKERLNELSTNLKVMATDRKNIIHLVIRKLKIPIA